MDIRSVHTHTHTYMHMYMVYRTQLASSHASRVLRMTGYHYLTQLFIINIEIDRFDRRAYWCETT